MQVIRRIGIVYLPFFDKDVKYSMKYVDCVRVFCIFVGVMISIRTASC
jgi:hypothetical protein